MRSPRTAASTTSAPAAYWCCCATPRDMTLARPALKLLADLGMRLPPRRRGALPAHRAGTQPGHAAACGHPSAGRRSRQLPPVRTCCSSNMRSSAACSFDFHSDVHAIEPGAQPSLVCSTGRSSRPTIALSTSSADVTQPMPLRACDRHLRCGRRLRRAGCARAVAAARLKVPTVPVYGYSITAPLRHFEAHPEAGPHSALMDERYKVAISRLGQRVRVAGSAEIGGQRDAHRCRRDRDAVQGAA